MEGLVIIGIYKITNLINGKIYIGQSIHIERRWIEHRSNAFNSKHKDYNNHLYTSIRKYGIENFSFEILEECTQQELNDKEIYWINYYDSTNQNKGYNFLKGGNQGGTIYNYQEIYEMWKSGYSCKEIQNKLCCSDQVITSALRAYHITEKEVRSRAIKKHTFVALSKDKKPLKIFYGMKSVSLFFTGRENYADTLSARIKKGQTAFGYYWDYLNENNYPEKELTDTEFLAYQMPIKNLSSDIKLEMSLKKRTVERPSREELKILIRNHPFTTIGKMFGVTDNAIRRWCDFENLPRKKKEINSYTDEEWELI